MRKNNIIHPILFSIYPILFLYSHNVRELLLADLVLPLVIAIIICSFLFLATRLALKDAYKAGIITSLWILVVFFYGYLVEILSKVDISIKHRHLMPTILFICSYITYFIFKSSKKDFFKEITKVFNIISLILVFINIISIIPIEYKKWEITKNDYNKVDVAIDANNQYPDIYYIILDEYASLDTIKEIWGYDNTWFKDELENMGFYVATNSKSRYTDTRYSIASSLNMEYIDENEDILELWNLINNCKVIEYLKSKGYYTIAIDNLYSQIYSSKGKMNVDLNINCKNEVAYSKHYSQFQEIIIDKTIIKPIKDSFANNTKHFEKLTTMYTIDKLKEIPYIKKSPKFTYAHFICPHVPFVFDENGQDVDPINSFNWKDKKYYSEQYVYISKQIRYLAEELVKNSKKPPIIIIQSDHGPRGGKDDIIIPQNDIHKIFNAYYFQGEIIEGVSNNISPINTFRVIFNKYFNESFELMED